MRFDLKKHHAGAFVLASSEDSTHSLEITDPTYDDDAWWHRHLVVTALARFDDGDVRRHRLSPRPMGKHRSLHSRFWRSSCPPRLHRNHSNGRQNLFWTQSIRWPCRCCKECSIYFSRC